MLCGVLSIALLVELKGCMPEHLPRRVGTKNALVLLRKFLGGGVPNLELCAGFHQEVLASMSCWRTLHRKLASKKATHDYGH